MAPPYLKFKKFPTDDFEWPAVGFDNPLPVAMAGSMASQFSEVLTAQRTPILELNSSYGPSALRYAKTETNGATVSASTTGEIQIATGTTSGAVGGLNSNRIGRYIPGAGAEIGVGTRQPNAPTGDAVFRWGGRSPNGEEGFYFKRTASRLFVVRERGLSEIEVEQANWNIDRLDGTGASGVSIDLSNGAIGQIDFTWYGYGQILFGFVASVSGQQQFIPCHSIDNQDFSGTSVQSPNLRLFVEVDAGTTTTNFDFFVGGMQYSVIGRYEPEFRYTSMFTTSSVSTSTTPVPLVSFRRKSGFENRTLGLAGVESIVTTEPHLLQVFLSPTLGGTPSWVDPTHATVAETALEADVSATSFTDEGLLVWQELVPAGQANKGEFGGSRALDFDVPNGEVVTLAARTVSGTGAVTTANLRMKELW